MNEIINNEGISLLSFIQKSNNASFKELLNKFRQIDSTMTQQLLVTKEQFHNHVMKQIEFDSLNLYPIKIEDSFLIMNYIQNNFEEHNFDEIIIETHQISYTHLIFLLGDLKFVQLLLNNMPNLHKYKCFMMKDVYKNTALH